MDVFLYLIDYSARTTPVPSIDELTALFGSLPTNPYQAKLQLRPTNSQTSTSFLTRYISWVRSWLYSLPKGNGNAFLHLKAGSKSVVFAVADAGTTSLYRFNEGCFDEWPMI